MPIQEATTFGAPPKEGIAKAVILGAISAALGGLVWYAIVRFTGYEVGWIAWGVGFAVGGAMMMATDVRGRHIAFTAGGLAAGGLLVGKLLIFQWFTGAGLVGELEDNPEVLRQLAMVEIYESGEFPDGIQTKLDALGEDDEVPEPLMEEIDAFVDTKLAAMGDGAAEQIAEQMGVLIRGNLSIWDGLWASIGLWDILWFFLAVGTAWKMLLEEPVTEEVPAAA